MTHLGEERRSGIDLSHGLRRLEALLLRATGARPVVCAYCGSAVPVGEAQCRGCGATATGGSREALPAARAGDQRHWLLPVLLCVVFPPALLVVLTFLLWRWLRRRKRGWILPLLVCVAFPPAVLVVAPALLWHPPEKPGAR